MLIAYRPKFIFTMPTYHNPTGRTMDEEQRAKLLGLAARYRVPIIEDDVYSRTRLQGSVPPSLYRMDRHNVVIYLSTFSKVLAPGLRLGWIAAPPHMVKQLSLIKMRANLFTEGLLQLDAGRDAGEWGLRGAPHASAGDALGFAKDCRECAAAEFLE